MSLEDKHPDILQNIEFAIVSVSRENVDLADQDVIKALGALIKHFQRKSQGKPLEDLQLPKYSALIFDRVEDVLKLRVSGEKAAPPKRRSFSRALREPSEEEIYLACLRKIEKSAKRWNIRNGKRGYLDFVEDFILWKNSI